MNQQDTWARTFSKTIKGKKMLYVEFFDTTINKKRQKSLQMPYTLKNKAKAEKEIIPALLLELESIKTVGKQVFEFNYYVQRYLSTKTELETFGEIKNRTRLITTYFGTKTDIRAVTTLDCESFFQTLKVINKTKSNYKNALRGIFHAAQKAHVINNNPAQLADIGKHEQEKVSPFSISETRELIETAHEIFFQNYLALAFYTGMRTGDMLELIERDLDFKAQAISIEREASNRVVKQRLKTTGSKRIIPMFDSVVPYLKSQVLFAREKNSIYLFCNDSGKHINSSDLIRGHKRNGR